MDKEGMIHIYNGILLYTIKYILYIYSYKNEILSSAATWMDLEGIMLLKFEHKSKIHTQDLPVIPQPWI